jgi:hypothetical protein
MREAAAGAKLLRFMPVAGFGPDTI